MDLEGGSEIAQVLMDIHGVIFFFNQTLRTYSMCSIRRRDTPVCMEEGVSETHDMQ